MRKVEEKKKRNLRMREEGWINKKRVEKVEGGREQEGEEGVKGREGIRRKEEERIGD